jgi:hypothetical protein
MRQVVILNDDPGDPPRVASVEPGLAVEAL